MAVSVFPTPLGPTRMKTPIGRRGSVRFARAVRIRLAIASRAWAWPMTRCSRRSFSEDGLDLVRQHLPDRDPRPAGDDLGDRLRRDARLHERRLALQLLELLVERLELGLQSCRVRRWARRRRGPPLPRSRVAAFAAAPRLGGRRLLLRGREILQLRPDLADLLDQLALLLPLLLQADEALLRCGLSARCSSARRSSWSAPVASSRSRTSISAALWSIARWRPRRRQASPPGRSRRARRPCRARRRTCRAAGGPRCSGGRGGRRPRRPRRGCAPCGGSRGAPRGRAS